jgi:hypothetical protein
MQSSTMIPSTIVDRDQPYLLYNGGGWLAVATITPCHITNSISYKLYHLSVVSQFTMASLDLSDPPSWGHEKDNKVGGSEWVMIDPTVLDELRRFAVMDPYVRSVMGIFTNHLKVANLTIQTSDDDLPYGDKPKVTESKDGDEQEQLVLDDRVDRDKKRRFSRMYAELGISALKNMWMYGFVCLREVVNKQPLLYSGKTRAKIIPTNQVLVYYRQDVNGEPEAKLYDRRLQHPNSMQGNQSELCKPLENVYVLFAEDDMSIPSIEGNRVQINSILASLLPTWKEEILAKRSAVMSADAALAFPVPWIQLKDASKSANDSSLPMGDPDQQRAQAFTERQEQQHVMQIKMLNEKSEQEIATITTKSESLKTQQMVKEKEALDNCIMIPPGYEYVPPTLGKAPDDYATMLEVWKEKVSIAFHIPMSLWSAGDTSGKSTMTSSTSQSPETAAIFKTAQMDAREQGERIVRFIYEFMNKDAMADSAAKKKTYRKLERKRKKDSDDEEMETSDSDDDLDHFHSEVTVMWEGIPDTETIERLMANQQLRYNCGIRLFSHKMGIPLEGWCPKEPITEQQMECHLKEKELKMQIEFKRQELEIKKEDAKLKQETAQITAKAQADAAKSKATTTSSQPKAKKPKAK